MASFLESVLIQVDGPPFTFIDWRRPIRSRSLNGGRQVRPSVNGVVYGVVPD